MINTNNQKHEFASLGQERIWSVCQSFPHVPLYNIGFSMYLEGDFDIRLTEKTLNIIIARHQALRTTFTIIDNQLKQVITPELALKMPVIYRENIALNEIPNEIKRIAHSEMLKHFDLQDGPLIRNVIIKFAGNRFGWIAMMHHAISDGWSMGLYAYETNIIYRALATNNTTNLPNVTMQYVDYVQLQRNKITSSAITADLNYWEKRLSGITKVNDIKNPVYSPSAHPNELAFKRVYHTLSNDTLIILNALSKQYKTTIFTILLIAFRLVLKNYQDKAADHIITVPTANRHHPSMHKTIGYLVNLVPIRIKLANTFSIADVIKLAISDLREDFAHGTVPIEYLSQHLQLNDSVVENPFYQTLFSFQNYPVPQNTYNYKIIELSDYFDVTEFNLTFRVSTYKSQSEIEITYNPNIHHQDAIQGLIMQYGQIIGSML